MPGANCAQELSDVLTRLARYERSFTMNLYAAMIFEQKNRRKYLPHKPLAA